jgi:short-subunit dehydrogenase
VAERLDKEGGIGLLVNNVGMNTEIPEYFQNISERTLLDMVRTNVDGTVRMTRAILPLMIKR